MKLQVSRFFTALVAQSVLNVILASWLYNEYVHNRFMQEYMAGFWSANLVALSLGSVTAGIVVGGSFFAFSRGRLKEAALKTSQQVQLGLSGLAPLDICPFCNISLVNLSVDRYHCRKCRRYFKK